MDMRSIGLALLLAAPLPLPGFGVALAFPWLLGRIAVSW
jgi:hypothetical protein